MPLEDRVKILAEILLRLFERSSSGISNALPCVYITYICYSDGNIHKENAEKANMSVVVVEPSVSKIDQVRKEIRDKSLTKMPSFILEEYTSQQIQDLIDENQVEYNRCMAFNSTRSMGGMKHQCSGTRKKGSIFCRRHVMKHEATRLRATSSSSSSSSKRKRVDEIDTEAVSVSRRGYLNK